MKDRLLKFLQVENISPSKFADEIGVQRSSISHILSGRNNPSLELIQKILLRFSYLNAEWLITGKGEMFKPEREPTLFDQIISQNIENKQVTEEIPIKENTLIEKDSNTEIQQSANITESLTKEENLKKTIDKVLILYSDGTASVYSINK